MGGDADARGPGRRVARVARQGSVDRGRRRGPSSRAAPSGSSSSARPGTAGRARPHGGRSPGRVRRAVTLSVLQVNTSDRGGGAEAVSLALHRALRGRGSRPRSRSASGAPARLAWSRSPRRARAAARAPRGPGWRSTSHGDEEDLRFPSPGACWSYRCGSRTSSICTTCTAATSTSARAPGARRERSTVVTLHDEWLFTATARTRSAASAGSRAAASAPTWTTRPSAWTVRPSTGGARPSSTSGAAARGCAVRWLLERARRSILAPAIASARDPERRRPRDVLPGVEAAGPG